MPPTSHCSSSVCICYSEAAKKNRHEIDSKVTSVRLWQSVIRLGLTMVKALSVELEVCSCTEKGPCRSICRPLSPSEVER